MQQFKYILPITILLAMALASLVVFQKKVPLENQFSDVNNHTRKDCQISETSPFEDKEMGIRFEFGSDLLVCDRISIGLVAGKRQIYLWDKNAFENSAPLAFFQGIVGGASMNLPPETPGLYRVQPGTSVTEKTERIAGVTTTIQVTQFAKCHEIFCPTARIAELRHGGNIFTLGEDNSGVGLFESFEFISPKGR